MRVVVLVAVFFEGTIAMRRPVAFEDKPSKTSLLRIAQLLLYCSLFILP